MRYAILIHHDPERLAALSDAEIEASHAEYMAISGLTECVGGAQLQPTQTATTIQVHDGETLVTDGPFAETKEVFGGFYLFELADMDAALAVAARVPAASQGGSAEVRPVMQRPDAERSQA